MPSPSMYSLVTMFFLDISTLLDYFQDNIIVPMRVKAVLRSFMRSVFLISFGITTLPKSSILLTTPVAFICFPPCFSKFYIVSIARIYKIIRKKTLENILQKIIDNFFCCDILWRGILIIQNKKFRRYL